MSQEEAIQPMDKDILSAVPKVVRMVEENIQKTRGKIIVVGVGNTSGVGNDGKDAKKAEKTVQDILKMMKKRKEEKKGRWSWLVGG
jgi:pheromone shutdown protein TraB